MYKPLYPIMFSWFRDQEYQIGMYEFLHSNGSYVREQEQNWKVRHKIKTRSPAIPFIFRVGDRLYTGSITDKRLVSRIIEYLQEYFNKKYTNCSSFANFLTTGTFIECEQERNLLVLTQGMREYRNERIRVGDMLCVLYARDKLWRSRNMPGRSRYVKSKKKRKGNNEFTHALSPRNKIMSAKEIEEACKTGFVADYHFLVCVAKDTDGPVWLSQGGRHLPGDETSPFMFSVGNNDGYSNGIPLLTLLKRRR